MELTQQEQQNGHYGGPRLNEPAPDFEALTTQGKLRLSDFRGKWVVLFSHPADFTPVCTTEFAGFTLNHEEFERRDVQLIGLSIDSVHSHLAWLQDVKEIYGKEVPFPLIADLDMKVAKLYGMLHPGASSTATVRSLFFIDPEGILRAMIHYPLTTGRSVPEIVRVLDALQAADENGVSTPLDWVPGEKVIVGAPTTAEEAAASEQEAQKQGLEYKSWYLRFKKLDQ